MKKRMNPKGRTYLGTANGSKKRTNVTGGDNTGRIIDCFYRKKWGILQGLGYIKRRGFTVEDISSYTGIHEHNLVRNKQRYIRKIRDELEFCTVGKVETPMGILDVYYPTRKLMSLSLNEAKHYFWDGDEDEDQSTSHAHEDRKHSRREVHVSPS